MMPRAIIFDSCREYDITPAEFFDRTRRGDVVACRVYTIARFRAAGLNNAAIARRMRLHYDTIRWWTKPQLRARKIEAASIRFNRRLETSSVMQASLA